MKSTFNVKQFNTDIDGQFQQFFFWNLFETNKNDFATIKTVRYFSD